MILSRLDRGSFGEMIGLDYFATVLSVRVNLATDEMLDAAAELSDLRGLRIACNSTISDRAWDNLKRLTALESLFLRGIRDPGMQSLCGLNRLRQLSITRTDIGDEGLANLAGLSKLEMLDLSGTNVSDAGLAGLANLSHLRRLDLSGTKVSNAGVRRLRAAMRSCRITH